jgi:hypothetical protein
MSIYVPNESEKEALKAILLQQAVVIGLYKNQIIPDGNTVFATLEELPTDAPGGSTYGYTRKYLTTAVKESASVLANFWTMTVNSAGKASAVFGAVAQEWVFLAPDVAAGNTIYGVFGYTLVLPFTAGVQPIKVGDVVLKGAVCAEVAGVNVTSGSWGAGDAAGNLYLKNQNGTFTSGALVDGSRHTSGATPGEIKVLTATPVAAGATYAVGDLFLIAGAGTGAVGRVTAISATPAAGTVTAVELLTGGQAYTVATQATTKISGSGDNALTVAVASLYTSGPAVTVATIAGDSSKKLMFVEALTTAIPIVALGQSVKYTPTLTLSSG